jgi:hypothetical protein
MNRTKIVTLLLAEFVLVAVGHHQLVQMSTQALNTPLVPYALAGTTSPSPSSSPSASPSPTPGIGQSCTPGFYKKRTSFINGGSCFSASSGTLVSTVFGTASGIDPCVSNIDLVAGPFGSCEHLRWWNPGPARTEPDASDYNRAAERHDFQSIGLQCCFGHS